MLEELHLIPNSRCPAFHQESAGLKRKVILFRVSKQRCLWWVVLLRPLLWADSFIVDVPARILQHHQCHILWANFTRPRGKRDSSGCCSTWFLLDISSPSQQAKGFYFMCIKCNLQTTNMALLITSLKNQRSLFTVNTIKQSWKYVWDLLSNNWFDSILLNLAFV